MPALPITCAVPFVCLPQWRWQLQNTILNLWADALPFPARDSLVRLFWEGVIPVPDRRRPSVLPASRAFPRCIPRPSATVVQ
jgi:hypothetical protein